MNPLATLFAEWGLPVLYAAWALPVAAALAVWVLGRRLGAHASTLMVTALAASALGAIYVASHAWLLDRPLEMHAYALWVGISHGPQLVLGVLLTNTTAVLFGLVALVAVGVAVFAAQYLKDDPALPRFWTWLGIFIGAMYGVVLSDNLILLFICWELVGVASWALIGFWHHKPEAGVASTTAFLVNRVADVALLAGILLLVGMFSTADLDMLRRLMQASTLEDGQWQTMYQLPGQGLVRISLSAGWLTATGILVCMGALGKSAQLFFMGWLPRAMAGPTPASALLHAATMVAAGVVVLARIYPMLDAPTLQMLAWVGSATALLAAMCASVQTDLKRVLAFSTVSQLGFMVMGMGVWAHNDALLHLTTHAFFKAGLFLAAGVVAHTMEHRRPSRPPLLGGVGGGSGLHIPNMGGLGRVMPFVAVVFALDAAALAGLPLTSGFLSKEGLLAGAFGWAHSSGADIGWLVPLMALAASGLTAYYALRTWLGVFAGPGRTPDAPTAPRRERLPVAYALPLGLFALGAVGFVFGPNPFSPTDSWVVSAWPPVLNPAVPFPRGGGSLYEPRTEATAARLEMGTIVLALALAAMLIGLLWAYFTWRREQRAPHTESAAAPGWGVQWLQAGLGLGWAYDKIGQGVIQLGRALAWVDSRALDRLWLSLAHWAGGYSGPSAHAPHQPLDPAPLGPPLSLAAVADATDRHIVDAVYTALAATARHLGTAARNPRRGQVQGYLLRALIWAGLVGVGVLVWGLWG